MPPPVPVFPSPPTYTLTDNTKLQNAVAAGVRAVVAAKSSHPAAPFALTLIDAGMKRVGGFNEDREHYSASILKAGALYAAHALLDMVTRYNNARTPASAADLFKGLRKEMNDTILAGSSLIRGGFSDDKYRLPHYEDVFAVTKVGTRLTVDFRTRYKNALDNMPDSDAEASVSIQGLGYSYINGVLERAGFFRPADKKGLWLGGDYAAWPQVRIACDNDGDTAQGATSRTIAHLVAVMLLDNNLPASSHVHMTTWLEKSAHGGHPSLFLRDEVANRLRKEQVTHGKIGVGELGRNRKGPTIFAESSMLKGVGSLPYVASFLNINYGPYAIDDAIDAIKEAIRIYETP